MSIVDYLISIALILLVIPQMWPRRLTIVGLMWPLLLIAWAAVDYVTVPELSGNNGVMFVGCVVVGVLFGIGCAMFTRVYWENGTYKVQATGLALLFWLLGVGGRLVFGIFAEHGGGERIYTFSMNHGLRLETWGTALISMALCEVVSRALVLLGKRIKQGAVTVPGQGSS